jgi:hypothetical protein
MSRAAAAPGGLGLRFDVGIKSVVCSSAKGCVPFLVLRIEALYRSLVQLLVWIAPLGIFPPLAWRSPEPVGQQVVMGKVVMAKRKWRRV